MQLEFFYYQVTSVLDRGELLKKHPLHQSSHESHGEIVVELKHDGSFSFRSYDRDLENHAWIMLQKKLRSITCTTLFTVEILNLINLDLSIHFLWSAELKRNKPTSITSV